MTRRRFAQLVCALLLALGSAACGGGEGSPLEIGVRRVGVDLAFQADKDIDGQKAPDTIVVLESAPPLPTPVVTLNEKREVVILQPPPVELTVSKCPKAAPGATPEKLATPIVEGLPRAGVYAVRNQGTVKTTGLFSFTLPFPPTDERIENVNSFVPDPVGQPMPGVFEYDIVRPLGADSTTDRLRTTPGSKIELVSRTYKQGANTLVFKPLLPIQLVGLGVGEGDNWRSAGTDPISGITLIVEGSVLARERVDVCGRVVEAFRVRSSERTVNLNPSGTPFSSYTNDHDPAEPREPNSYLVAPQYGGLFVAVETHETTTIGALTVIIDNVGTKSSIEPAPLS